MASRVFPIRIFLFIFAHFRLGSCGFDCPGPIISPHGLSYARIESNITGRVTQEYAKLRIELIFDPSIEHKPYKGLVREAADFWQNVLSVKPANGRIYVSRRCESEEKTSYKKDRSGKRRKYCLGSCETVTKCHDFEIPQKHLDGCNICTQDGKNCKTNEPEPGAGVENADTVFYVSANDTKNCGGSTVAYAGACDIEPSLDRPVFGLINVCPTNAASHSDDNKAMLRAIKHEMMHALAFDPALFRHFRFKNGTFRWERDNSGKPKPFEDATKQNVLKIIDRKWHVRSGEVLQSERVFLVTPSVVREVRAHFNCTDLEGAELEDIPREGSQLGHFEARVFYDDAMKPNMDNGKGLFSSVSFAVLEDSGWYQVDYSHAEAMDYGKKLGCDFCMKSCKFWMDKKRKEGKSLDPYCDSPDLVFKKGVTCIGPKKLFTGCPLTPLSSEFIKLLHGPNSFDLSYELPRKYQHFDEISNVPDYQVPQSGSFDAYADCCPIPVENYDATQVLGYAYHCEDEAKDDEDRNEEDESNESSSLGLPALWLFLFHLIVILL